ncbi:MAG: 2-oxoacid:acceptor oxidoreductase family protein, partial [Candidatus Promineifilaceae bacterium]|nr:2-oxoacid:acceptor oxidoreductase family protein [Candidatus Promineifilaceae bacterium]
SNMAEYSRLTGRPYDVVEPYRMDDADYAVVGMGSLIDTAEATVDWIREHMGIKVGTVHVTSFRPFPSTEIVEVLQGVRAFSVLERMDNPMAQSNPLTREIKAAFADAVTGMAGYPALQSIPTVFSGSVGLGSRDVRPGDIIAVVRNMVEEGRPYFVTGIKHQMALTVEEDPDIRPTGAFSMRGHSVGGFGSVTTNKVIATIAGDVFGKKVQAYPKYGSEKKGLPTTYYLTVADDVIRTHSELNYVDFVPLNDANALLYTSPLKGLQPGGTLFINTNKATPEEVWASVPPKAKAEIRAKEIRVMAGDAVKIAKEESPIPDLEVRMQGIVLLGVFLKATPFSERAGLSDDEVMAGVEKAVRKYFGKRGEAVVQANLRTIQRGYNESFTLKPEVLDSDYTIPVLDPRADVQLFV